METQGCSGRCQPLSPLCRRGAQGLGDPGFDSRAGVAPLPGPHSLLRLRSGWCAPGSALQGLHLSSSQLALPHQDEPSRETSEVGPVGMVWLQVRETQIKGAPSLRNIVGPQIDPAITYNSSQQEGRSHKEGHTPSLRTLSSIPTDAPFDRIQSCNFSVRKAAKYSFYSSCLQVQVRISVYLLREKCSER